MERSVTYRPLSKLEDGHVFRFCGQHFVKSKGRIVSLFDLSTFPEDRFPEMVPVIGKFIPAGGTA